MIDTKELRVIASKNCYDGNFVNDALIAASNALCDIADELDRLYRDTTPLSREELEEVLKEVGCTLSFDYPTKTKYRSSSGETWIYLDPNNRAEIFGDVVFKGPLSAVTRQTLRACGVIK